MEPVFHQQQMITAPIYVYQTRTARVLSFDGKIYQSCMKLNDINGLNLSYTQAMMAGLLFIPIVRNSHHHGAGRWLNGKEPA